MKNYLIDFSTIENLSIQEAFRFVNEIQGIDIREMKVQDLSCYNGEFIYPGNGVYLFREGTTIRYVGKAESMSFIERIPKHFDIRKFAWFNRLLELTAENQWRIPEEELNDEAMMLASTWAFENLNLVLIHFTSRDRIARTERMFRTSETAWNRFRKVRINEFERMVCEY